MSKAKRSPLRLAPIFLGVLCCCATTLVMTVFSPRQTSPPTSLSTAENTSAVQAPEATATPQAPQATPRPAATSAWRPLGGSIYAGVKMYYGQGDDKELAFTILGGNEGCSNLPSGRGLFVEYPDGGREWKDRSAMIDSPYNFIRADDPALKTMEWFLYPCP